MEPIKNIIRGLEETWPALGKGTARVAGPEAILKKILTPRDFRHIRIRYLRQGTLGLDVDSSTRLYCLSLQKETLLEKLSKALPGIKNIRFYIGDIKHEKEKK